MHRSTGDENLFTLGIRRLWRLSCITAILVLAATPAHAAFMEQMAISTKAISMANTCTADPPGLMSIHYNPAGLSNLPEGKVFSQGFTLPWLSVTRKFKADPDFEGFFGQWGPQDGQIHDPVDGTEDTNSSGMMYIPIYDHTINFMIGPNMGLSSRKPESRWTFAVGNYAPFAGGMNHKSDSPVNWNGRSLALQHMVYAAPAASYKLTPDLSVGMSVGMGQTAMRMRMNMRSPNELVALTRVLGDATKDLEIPILSELTLPPPWFGGGMGPYDKVASLELNVRDDFSPNYNLGMLWSPEPWFSFGLTYQSEIVANLNGSYIFTYSEQWQKMMAWQGSSPLLLIVSGMFQLPTQAVAQQAGILTATQKFPQRVQSGIAVKPGKRLKFLFDVNWVEWSVDQENNFQTDQDIQLLQLVKMLGYTGGHRNLIVPRRLKDTVSWGTALEFQATQKLALRCGYEWRPTSVRPELADLLYFAPDLHNVGVGAGLKLPHGVVLDLGFSCLFNPSFKIPNNSSTNVNS
ncbi:MAG: outer membrane protein transport protein, partial [Desulfosalsimonadaceae bacterium]|nr:outer membrane protein transport protein [Desulfosalsimonadaceae bacterium]